MTINSTMGLLLTWMAVRYSYIAEPCANNEQIPCVTKYLSSRSTGTVRSIFATLWRTQLRDSLNYAKTGIGGLSIVTELSSQFTPAVKQAQFLLCNSLNICLLFKKYYTFIKNILKITLNLWLKATPVNYTSATDWQMETRRDSVISITLRQVYWCRLS